MQAFSPWRKRKRARNRKRGNPAANLDKGKELVVTFIADPVSSSIFSLQAAAIDIDMAELYFTTTSKGKGKLIYGGFSYAINKASGSVTYWRCCRYNERSCRGTMKTVDGELSGDPSKSFSAC